MTPANQGSFRREPVLSQASCHDLLKAVRALPEHFWYPRKELAPGRAMPGASCDYFYLTDAGQPPELNKLVRSLAPRAPTWHLAECVFNRYLPGQYIGPHRDRDRYQINMVIPLQAEGDGVIIGSDFYRDEIGMATIIQDTGPVHEVPPVNKERYVLIYLYEEF